MPTTKDYRLNLLRVAAALSGLYLVFWWIEALRWNHDKWRLAVHLTALAVFLTMSLRAWRGSTRAGVVAALCALSLVIPFTSLDRFLLAMAMWASPRGVSLYISSTVVASAAWVLLPIVTNRLTSRSTRTPPALSSALFLLLASSAPFIASVQAGPVSFFR